MTTQETVQNAWDDYAEAPQTEWESQEGLRRITHYNPDPKKNQVQADGQSLGVYGGFGAKVGAGTWRFGAEADVPHGGNTDKEIVARVLRDVVILGWSPRHLILMGKPDGERFTTKYVKDYTEIPHQYSAANKESKYGFKVSGERVYYICFLADPELQVHSLAVRGNASGESAAIEKAVQRAAQRISFLLNKEAQQRYAEEKARIEAEIKRNGKSQPMPAQPRDVKLGVFAVKLNIGVAAPKLTGKGVNQSQIAPLVVDVAALEDTDLRKSRLVPGPIYKRLAEISAEVKALVETTDWEGTPTIETLVNLLQAPNQPQLTEGDMHESDEPAVDFKKAAEEMKAKAQPAPAPTQPANPEDNITLGVYVSSEENMFAWMDYLRLHNVSPKQGMDKLRNCFPSMAFATFGACDIPLSECRAAIES